MKEFEIGMKINMKAGPSFFGLEQVNAALKSGASVVSVQEGAVITSKVGEDADNVEFVYRLSFPRWIMRNQVSNKADAPNPAMTSLFHCGRQERGVGDLQR